MAHFDLPLEELRNYRPEVREPADFDDFWAQTLSEARQVTTAFTLTPTDLDLPHARVDDLTFPGFAGDPIKAWFTRPAVGENLPVVVQYQGYGGGRGLSHDHTFWASAGIAHVMMDTRGQGGNWGNGGETPDPGGSGASSTGFMTRGIQSPADYYYRRLFTDAVRAVDVARQLPGVDPSRVVVLGGSQGGGISLAVAGLVPDLTAAVIDVAFLCNFPRATTITDDDPYGEIRRYLAVHRNEIDQTYNTLSYFDGVNFAKRAVAPSLWSVGLMDTICPPSTTFSAFNWYGERAGVTDKRVEVYPFNGHEGGQGFHGRTTYDYLKERFAI